MSNSLLVIDLGTSGLRASILTHEGKLLASRKESYQTLVPRPGWMEQNPEDWWRAMISAVGRLSREAPQHWGSIAGIALTGQSPGVVLIDATGNVVRPCIIWSDRRAEVEAEELSNQADAAQWQTWTGLSHGYAMRPAKLKWLSKAEPRSIEAARWLLQPKDFLIYRLTGRAVIDRRAMRGSGLSHEEDGFWTQLGVPLEMLPEPVEPFERVGNVESRWSEYLPPGVAVIPGTYDGLSGLLGCGLTHVGEAYNIGGTSQVAGLLTNSPAQVKGLGCLPLDSNRFSIGGPTQSGGGTLWVALRQFGFNDYSDLEELASRTRAGAGGLLFIPYLEGERAPVWDSNLRGALIGMSSEHARSDVARALIEGHAFAVADILDRARSATSQRIDVLHASGGAARSRLWLQVRADVLGCPVIRPRVVNASSVGAALYGAVGLGWYKDIDSASSGMVSDDLLIEPEASISERLADYRSAARAAQVRPFAN